MTARDDSEDNAGLDYLAELGMTPGATKGNAASRSMPRRKTARVTTGREKYYKLWLPRSVFSRLKSACMSSGRQPAEVLTEALDKLGVHRDAFSA